MATTGLKVKVQTLRGQIRAKVTGKSVDDAVYKNLREELLSDTSIKNRLPYFVKVCRDLEAGSTMPVTC